MTPFGLFSDQAKHRLYIMSVLASANASLRISGTRPMTQRFLAHYLSGAGTSILLEDGEMNQIVENEGFKSVMGSHLKRIMKEATSGCVDVMDSDWFHHVFPPEVNPVDLFSAFHGIGFRNGIKGRLSSVSSQARFVGELLTEVQDEWGFGSDGDAADRRPFNTLSFLPSAIRNIREEEFRQLEIHGYTRSFRISGRLTKKVDITVTEDTTTVTSSAGY